MKKGLAVLIWLILPFCDCLSQTLAFDGVTEVRPLKRGKAYSIKWSGGAKDQTVKIELYNLTSKVQSWDETLNEGEHVVKLNSKLKPGTNYHFKIVAGGDEVSSQAVQIRRKIPLGLTISAIIVVPAVVVLFLNRYNGPDMTIDSPTSPTN